MNHNPIDDFQGLSPNDMHGILYSFLGPDCAIQLKTPPEELFTLSPVWNLFNYVTTYLEQNEKLKLTAVGYFPPKFVKELYATGFHQDEAIETGMTKLSKEIDVPFFGVVRFLLFNSPYVKKVHNTLTLTKKHAKSTTTERFNWLMKEFILKYQWRYMDWFDSDHFGQFGVGFIFYLMKIHQVQNQQAKFYTKNYLQAFPMLLQEFRDSRRDDPMRDAIHCMESRVFQNALVQLGLIVERVPDEPGKSYDEPFEFDHTALFDELLEFETESEKPKI